LSQSDEIHRDIRRKLVSK